MQRIDPAVLAYSPDGTPYAPAYDDVYHGRAGGLAQARAVFLAGNGLPQRWQGRSGFVVLETGFGLGLNFLATWEAWRADPARPQRLHFVSLERHPFRAQDLARLQAAWPELAPLAAELRAQWPPLVPGPQRLHFEQGAVTLTLFFGDAPALLPQLQLRADALYLDGFAPNKNAALWAPEFLAAAARKLRGGASVATWCAAGAVRRALQAAGFAVERRPGHAGKREMLTGIYGGAAPDRVPALPRQALILGAGLAGTAMAQRLAERGWSSIVVDQAAHVAAGASGNLAGAFRPLFSRDDNRLARLSRAAYCYALARWRELQRHGLKMETCGVLQLAPDESELARWHALLADFPADYLQPAAAGYRVPQGGWLDPASLCRAQLSACGDAVQLRLGTRVEALARAGEAWLALDAQGCEIARAPQVILANAHDAARLAPALPLRSVRGQLSYLPAATLPPFHEVRAREGYVIPAVDGCCVAGASYDFGDDSTALSVVAHEANLRRAQAIFPGWQAQLDPRELAGRVAFRAMTPDRLPIAGALPAPYAGAPVPLAHWPRQEGLHALTGYGSRGIVWCALLAELAASQISGEPLPLEQELADAVDPARFAARARKQAQSRA